MRKNYLMKSISIILMLLAMMFSCQPVTEDISSGNSNSNNTDQGGNTGGGGGEQTADTITITLVGTDDKEFDKFDIKIGEEIELPANVERFVCWNTKADGSGESYTGKIKFTKDMTLYLIVLVENAYTITYELDGGVNDKANPLSFTADDKITLKNPSKDGYRFSGWYEKADFSGTAVKGWDAGDKKANVTLYAKWRDAEDKVLAEDGTGVYSYSVCIDAFNGRKDYPSFSIFLMTDGQIESMKSDGGKWVEKSEFLEATKTEPVYQIGSYGRMGADTTKTGDYAVWGGTPVNGKLEYYEGISASIEGTNFIVTVDMTKLANVELKSYLDGEETYMTDDDIVSLSNYKPYISMSLDSDYAPEAYSSYIVEFDLDYFEQLYGMNSGASFPTNLKENAPAVPTFYDLTYLFSSISQYPVELKNNNSLTFVAPANGEVMFAITNYNWTDVNVSYPMFPIQIGGEMIESLNKNFPLDDLYAPKNRTLTIKSGVLTAGNMYTITLDVRGNNEAYAKVSEVKPTAIKINSTNHKTSYYQGDDINVANLTVEATIVDGTKFTVNVTAGMISGFDSSKLGKQTLTITLDDCTATYSVEVKDVVVTELNVTADELVDTIKGLTAGEYYSVKVSGVMTSEIMRDLQDEMEDSYGNKDVARIALDLGNTTGLTEMSYSFYYCHELTSIVFPEGMTSIPSFNNCSNLTSITIPASVQRVGRISNCKKFTTFEVAENNEYYSTSDDGKILENKDKTVLFSYPSASGDVTIPNGVISIGYGAFSGCNSLTSVIIPDSVTSIDYYAFENCENLESVTIGAGVTSIGSNSFRGCCSLTSIEVDSANPNYSSSDDGKMLLSKDKATLVAYPSAAGDVTIPNGVISIGSNVFSDCDSLTSVTIPDSVTTIEYNAFWQCQNLESVTLGKNVKEIESNAFEYCRSLTSVTIPDSVTSIGYAAFRDCESLTSVTFENTSGWNYSDDSNYANGKEINVTDEAKSATYLTDSYSDFYWYRVTTVTATASNIADIISNFSSGVYKLTITGTINLRTLESIGSAMKNNRSMLIELDLSGTTGLAEIPEEAFAGCSLIGMVLPEGITTIGNSAFSSCNFKKLEIPNSVTYIGSYALPYDLEYNEYNNGYYLGNSENPYLVFVRLKDSEYSSSSCEINSKTKIIAGNAFCYFENLTNVTIPDGVISIGDSAFYYCENLTSVIIPDSVTIIGDEVFSNCENLISVTISAGVTTIGDYAFYYCENLTSVTIPDSVTTIGNNAFYSCNSLTSVTIPASVTTIGNDAFCSCYNLTTVNYKGEEWDWWNILIGRNNDYLTDATINYNYSGE